MQTTWLLTFVLTAAAFVMTGCQAGQGCCEADRCCDGPYRHVVLFKFKDGTSAEDVRRIEEAFAQLPKQIKTIKSFEYGTNISPEGLANGFTHCFLVTFEKPEDIKGEGYLDHPVHKDFVTLLKPHLDKVTVVDYVARQ